MSFSSDELRYLYKMTQYIRTEKLHELEYYLRFKNTYPIRQSMQRITELVLMKRGEKPYNQNRLEVINYLNKCWAISNPLGRLSARIIGYISKFVDMKSISNLNHQ